MRRFIVAIAVLSQFAVAFAAHAQSSGPVANEPVPVTSKDSQTINTQSTSSGTQSTQTQTSRAQTTAQDAGIGEHVSSVSPEHPLAHRRDFGECVVEIAMGGDCPHEEEQ